MRQIDLSAIGTNVGSSGLLALSSVISTGQLTHLTRVTLRDTTFKKNQLEVLLRALLEGCQTLEELDLSGTSLCLSSGARYCLDALRLVCSIIVRPGGRLRNLGLRGTHLCALPPGCDTGTGDKYSLDGIEMLCESLVSRDCVLQVRSGVYFRRRRCSCVCTLTEVASVCRNSTCQTMA